MDKYNNGNNKDNMKDQNDSLVNKNPQEDSNEKLKNTLLGNVDNPEEMKDENDGNEKMRLRDVYMQMTSEMANEVTPESNDAGLEKDTEYNIAKNAKENKPNDKENNNNYDGGNNSNKNSDNNCRPKDKTKIAMQWLLLAVAVVVIGFLIYGWVNENKKLQMNQNELVGVYYKSFDNISSNMNDLEKKLAKVQIVSSEEMYVTLLTEIWSTSNIMRNEIGQLPLKTEVANELSRFVTQTGDFCYILTKDILDGKEVTADQQEQLYNLQQNCAELANKLTTMRVEGQVEFLTSEEQEVVETASEEEDNPYTTLKSAIQQYPSLIYDGPFSESTEKQTAKWVEAMEEVTPEQAQEIAAKVAGDDIKEITRVDDVEGKLPAYTFSVTYNSGLNKTVNITKKGGKPLYLIQETNLEAAAEKPNDDQIAKSKAAAKTYIESIGFKNMEPNYIQYYSGQILINFTPVVDDVTIYPDIVKVWVDITTYDITGLDAKNYIYAHVDREINSPKLTTEEAKAYVSNNLTIESVKLCMIPNESLTEDYCYEFSGIYKGLRFLVYIDSDTGAERQVMEILDTEQGELIE